MPPQRTHNADPDAIVVNIADAVVHWKLDILAAQMETEEHLWNPLEREFEEARAGWIDYDLELFAGTGLTESAKQVWRKAVRDLVADGILERQGNEIRLTHAGHKRVERLIADAPHN
jgi:hypothetical protein